MNNENAIPQAAPLEWKYEDGALASWESKCGVYRIESDIIDGITHYPVFERGHFLGNQPSFEQACDLCQWDRQREFCIMGGFQHEGIATLWER